jgi:mono/diheme cytochrome c family protein
LELTVDEEAGADVYDDNCATCHGDDGTGDIGSDLTQRVPEMSDDEIVSTVLNGLKGTTMPSFADVLDNQAIADVVAFTKTGFDSE